VSRPLPGIFNFLGEGDPQQGLVLEAAIGRHPSVGGAVPASEDGAAVATTTVITMSFTLEEG